MIKLVLLFTHRNEDVEEVLQGGELRDELLHHFAEGLKNGVVVNTCQVKAEWYKRQTEVNKPLPTRLTSSKST